MKTTIIAEPGSTCEGIADRLMALIHLVGDAGASIVKVQWVSRPERLCARRRAADYLASYRLLEWPRAWHLDFLRAAHARGMRYWSSVYLVEDVARLAPVVDGFKISSFEAGDYELITAATATELPVIVSTGMLANESHIFQWLLNWRATDPARRWLLHCVSQYPCALSAMNLRVLRRGWAGFDGLSDHSRHLWGGALAVAYGARVIEAHVRLDDTPETNQDYGVSWTPHEFAVYCAHIREADAAGGDGVKAVQDGERAMCAYRVSV